MDKLVRSELKENQNAVAKKAKQMFNPNEVQDEIWVNELYQVNVRRGIPAIGLNDADGKPALMTWLSIKRLDKQAKPDWRHFQWIKNQLVGEENEGAELYPAESRLIDGANQFHIWVFENSAFRFPFGFNEGRIVTEKPIMGETQRKFPPSRKPQDTDENEKKVLQMIMGNQQQFKEYHCYNCNTDNPVGLEHCEICGSPLGQQKRDEEK